MPAIYYSKTVNLLPGFFWELETAFDSTPFPSHEAVVSRWRCPVGARRTWGCEIPDARGRTWAGVGWWGETLKSSREIVGLPEMWRAPGRRRKDGDRLLSVFLRFEGVARCCKRLPVRHVARIVTWFRREL